LGGEGQRKGRLFVGSQGEMKFIWLYRQYTNSSYKTWLVLTCSCSLKWTLWAGVYPILFTSRAESVWGLHPFSLSTRVLSSNWIQIEDYRAKFPLPIDPPVCTLRLRSCNCIVHCTRILRVRDCVREMNKQGALFHEISTGSYS
jgi:hypothetical protein